MALSNEQVDKTKVSNKCCRREGKECEMEGDWNLMASICQ